MFRVENMRVWPSFCLSTPLEILVRKLFNPRLIATRPRFSGQKI